VQAAAQGHVHFLQAAADRQHRHFHLDRQRHDAQRRGIAGGIVQVAGVAGFAAVVMGFDVAVGAGEQQAVQVFQHRAQVQRRGQRGDQHRQAACPVHHRAYVFFAHRLEGVMPDLFAIRGQTDQRDSTHRRLTWG
jgi:hypothetical protein